MKTIHKLIFCIVIHLALAASDGVVSQNITFTLSAEGLPCKDIGIFKQPDAFVSIYSYIKHHPGVVGEPQPLGSTSIIENDSNPEWTDKFSYNWKNGTGQTWLLWVFDHDSATPNDPIGGAEVSVDRFMGNDGSLKLKFFDNTGSITITRFPYERKSTATIGLAFKLSARNLPPRDRMPFIPFSFAGEQSDPYSKIYYQNGNSSHRELLHQTGIFTNMASPTWPRPIEFREYEPNQNQTLYFKLYDRDLFSQDEFLGDVSISVDVLRKSNGSLAIPLKNSEGSAEIILHTLTATEDTHDYDIDLDDYSETERF